MVRLGFATEGLCCGVDVPLDGTDRLAAFGEVGGTRPFGTD